MSTPSELVVIVAMVFGHRLRHPWCDLAERSAGALTG